MNGIALPDFASIGTKELNYVGNHPDPYDLTVISIQKGTKKGFVKLHKTPHSLYEPEFIGVDNQNLGTFTTRNGLVHALTDWSEKNGWKIEMSHVSSRTGDKLDVNISAI
ncbi:hypothetical protein [Mesorhizobium sp. WSM2561]|uniref:hypothetical protein n=1 Tax=Mesorhizobium sp. WSM2561 TaxID=1040985 RepID=UPI00048490E8|nr:hypothetical protein [Mesorhizobium sp. WSM2561]